MSEEKRDALLAALMLACIVAGSLLVSIAKSGEPTVIRPLAVTDFQPVVIPATPTTSPPQPRWHDFASVAPSMAARVPQPTAAAKTEAKATLTGRSIRGKASWYCNQDDPDYRPSVCHYRYQDGPGADLYAAACGKLRRAMGGEASRHWRGKTVVVTGNGRSVTVRLIDWCGSEDKTIDLYRDSMDVLGPSSGGYNVTVKW